MNTRLEISSRLLGFVLLSNPIIAPRGAVDRALVLADDLIVAEEATRKVEPTSENAGYDVYTAHSFLVNDLTILREHVNAMIDGTEGRVAQLNTIMRSLDIVLAKNNARRKS